MKFPRRSVAKALLGGTGAALAGLPVVANPTTSSGHLSIKRGRVEWRDKAQGIDTIRLRFHWTLQADSRARHNCHSDFRLRVCDDRVTSEQ